MEPRQTKEPVEEAPIENVEPSAPEDFIPEDQFSNVPQQEESEGKEGHAPYDTTYVRLGTFKRYDT